MFIKCIIILIDPIGGNVMACRICGKSSGIYPLCPACFKLRDEGKIVKCDKCGEWHYTNKKCKCGVKPSVENAPKDLPDFLKEGYKNDVNADIKCVVCGANSNGKPQCRECYYESLDFMDGLDKNTSVRKTRDYYYNLKERIFIIKSLEEAQKQCNKLIAIAMVAKNYNDDSSLIDKVYTDVETLIKNKQAPLENKQFEEERKEKDEHKSKVNTAQDGHNVDSDMEVRIDDVLYNACILHCYGKSIDEITEKRKKCDWFIPIVNNQGIYIEYWGMKTQKYLEERKEKEELYKKHDIPYIGIEAEEPKADTQTFKSNLIRDLTKLAEERFGFMPKWKK